MPSIIGAGSIAMHESNVPTSAPCKNNRQPSNIKNGLSCTVILPIGATWTTDPLPWTRSTNIRNTSEDFIQVTSATLAFPVAMPASAPMVSIGRLGKREIAAEVGCSKATLCPQFKISKTSLVSKKQFAKRPRFLTAPGSRRTRFG